jgi:hypothetical protein
VRIYRTRVCAEGHRNLCCLHTKACCRRRTRVPFHRYIPGHAGPATISIALTPIARAAIMTAQTHDHVAIVTEDRATYRLVGWELDEVDENILIDQARSRK